MTSNKIRINALQTLLCFYAIWGISYSVDNAQFFETDASSTQDIVRFNGGLFPYVSLCCNGQLFSQLDDIYRSRHDLTLST